MDYSIFIGSFNLGSFVVMVSKIGSGFSYSLSLDLALIYQIEGHKAK